MSYEEERKENEEKDSFKSELLDAIDEQKEEIEEETEIQKELEPEPELAVQKEEAPVAIAKPAVKPEEKKKEKRVVYSHIVVDLWRTKMHKEEWGIRLDAQRAQKDRQWTRDMDQIGKVIKDGDDYGILALRENYGKKKIP